MALPGIYLVMLGGSPYYVIAGILILFSAVLVLRRRDSGIMLYLLVFFATIAWSLYEVGLDGWALMPRLLYLAVGAIWLLLMPVKGRGIRLAGVSICLLLLAGTVYVHSGLHKNSQVAITERQGVQSSAGEWINYGNSAHGTRYSSLVQITPDNVAGLTPAWTYHAGIFGHDQHSAHLLELTPIMVDGYLYGCNAHSEVFALDPVTGKEIWRHSPLINDSLGGRGVCRGVSFFRAPSDIQECPTRILVGTVDNRLIALDGRTGKSCASFGNGGSVDLSEGEGLAKYPKGWINPTSPPAIIHGTAVIGSFIVDNKSIDVPPGVIRGYDAVTGKLKWAFDPGRPQQHAGSANGQTYVPATPNSWGVFSGDEALGLVYLPMGNGSPDVYGINRTPETDRFSSAVVALDADTGSVRWLFQAIHHDLWDYDLAAQPVLVDFPARTGSVPALIQATKTGQLFVLDRRTGRPLTKVEEKPVPASAIPKERWAHTQPFSTGMPDFGGPKLSEADMWGITPFDQLYCRIQFRKARYEGPYTPMGLRPTIRSPGELGGIDWGSVSYDEAREILVVNSNRMADYDKLIVRQGPDRAHQSLLNAPRKKNAPAPLHAGGVMEGTPYAVRTGGFLSGLGIPCQRPPYGFLTAVDMKTQKVLWQRPLGNASNSGPFGVALGLPFSLGTPNIGGSIVTRGGVIFVAATQDKYFRAVDERNGKVLWNARLPAGGQATPITYQGRDGAQYVVIAAGGSQRFQTGDGDTIIAYRLKS
jgi:quinoprotein glucose dehydrogenase